MEKKNIKEQFCVSCLAVPLAVAGAGAGAYGATQSGSHKKTKKLMLWSGGIMILLSILIGVYFLFIKKCTSCR